MSRTATESSTAVYASTNYGSLFGHWAMVDRVPHLHGIEASICYRPGDDGHVPWTNFPGLRRKPLAEAGSLLQSIVVVYISVALDYILRPPWEQPNLR